jgi:cytidyltransferase-like protein
LTKAIYPATFDPIHFGHIDIVKRAVNIFSKSASMSSNNASARRGKMPSSLRRNCWKNGRETVEVSIHPSWPQFLTCVKAM